MNTAVNGSSCSISLNPPTAEKIGKTFAYCMIVVVSLVGNSFIGTIVYKTQTLRKPINYFIVNMAMSDLLYPIFLILPTLTLLHVKSWLISGPLGQALCKLVSFLPGVPIIVSSQSLVLIAVDRFGAVVFPLRFPLISSKLCPFFILATWIIAMAFCSPNLFAFKLGEYDDGKLFCVMQWNEAFGVSSSYVSYILAFFVVFLYVPLALLIILYSVIIIKLKTQRIPGKQSANAEQQRAKRNRNVLKMAIAIVLGFVLCNVPYSIINLLLFYAQDLPCSISLYGSITRLMAFSNCAINPCICFTFSANYRQGLKRLLKCFNTVQPAIE